MTDMTINVLVLGGSGMLGSTVVSHLSTRPEFNVSTTVRMAQLAVIGKQKVPAAKWHEVVLGTNNDAESLKKIGQFDWIINCT